MCPHALLGLREQVRAGGRLRSVVLCSARASGCLPGNKRLLCSRGLSTAAGPCREPLREGARTPRAQRPSQGSTWRLGTNTFPARGPSLSAGCGGAGCGPAAGRSCPRCSLWGPRPRRAGRGGEGRGAVGQNPESSVLTLGAAAPGARAACAGSEPAWGCGAGRARRPPASLPPWWPGPQTLGWLVAAGPLP